jgi:hypothetical protein
MEPEGSIKEPASGPYVEEDASSQNLLTLLL